MKFVFILAILFSSVSFAGPCDYLGKVNGELVVLIEGTLDKANYCETELAINGVCLIDIDKNVPPIKGSAKAYIKNLLSTWSAKSEETELSICGYQVRNSNSDPVLNVFVGWTRF